MKKVATIFTILASLLLGQPTIISASEGIYELRNTIGENARCYAISVLLPTLNYRVLLSCRDITYPGDAETFNYSVWATNATDGAAFYLGELGVGKAEFATKIPFSTMFITSERTQKPKSPTGGIVMQGRLQQNPFLDTPGVHTPLTPESEELAEAKPIASPLPSPVKKSAVSRILAAGGVIAFIGIFALVLVLFVITKK